MAGLTDLERRCVLPFYLTMMGLNALSHDVPFGALREVAQGTPVKKSGWSCRLGGAVDRTGIGPSVSPAGRH